MILARGSQPSAEGRYQLRSPSNFIVAGSRIARTIVASIRIATARPMPISFMSMMLSVAKIEKTATITIAALVTVPAVAVIPSRTASSLPRPPVDRLADPAEDQHVVVHREAEQDHEQEERQPGADPSVGVEAEQRLAQPVLEDEDEDPVGGAHREQVEHDRLDRDDDRAEGDQQQQERKPEDEGEDQRQALAEQLAEVLRLRPPPGDVDLGAVEHLEKAAGTSSPRIRSIAAVAFSLLPLPTVGTSIEATVPSSLSS